MKSNHHYEARYVRAALRAFSRGGYFGTSMEDIANEAGVSQPRVSQVFDGKLSAYRAAHRMALTAVIDAVQETPRGKGGFDPAKATRTLRTLLDEQPETMMMVFHSMAAASSEAQFAATARITLSSLTDTLVAQGATADQARAVLAEIVLAMVLVAADASGDDESALQQVVEAARAPRPLRRAAG